ncbi:MAG: selenide, water dikinase SelD, partial [Acetobacteraceae bacterium]|nr:selenide, water dikinase SelD [Acetobacteraceae bacterium]
MLMAAGPVVKDVVLVGAGHAHVAVLRNFGMKPIPGVRLTLITREVDTPYSGMLPGHVAGHYTADDILIDTGPLARFAGARLHQDEAVGLDLAGRRVICRDRPPVPYDILSIDIGSRPNTEGVPGAAEHALPVKPIDSFLGRFAALRARVLEGRARHILQVGAGAGGVELLLAAEHRLRHEVAAAGGDAAALRFTLLAAGEDVLGGFPPGFRARFRALLAARGITVETGARAAAVEAGAVLLADGRRIAADEILWTTQAAPAGWLAGTGLALDAGGFLRVDAMLRATGREDVFAAGDTIAFDPGTIPRSGVYAVRAGPVLADNIRAVLTGGRLRPYRPQRDALYLVSTGGPHAVGTRNGLVFGGGWVWRWKDWIDRRVMRRFRELPEMATPAAGPTSPLADKAALRDISAIAMRCGGCGAKVGATVLSRALGQLEPFARPEILVGLAAPDDAAVVDTGGPLLSVQTVDYFRAIVDDPWRFGMIAANHALGDIYAMGGVPQTALAIATIPYGLEAKVEAELSAMMEGANAILRDAGCALVGGHTSEGAELSLGFALNGLVARDAFLRKGGLRPGDALVLTKPIGTGTLLAADMRGLARARWVQAAIRHMCHSNRRAAEVLAAHGAGAATDVTGFGLLGHLVEMTRASEVDARLVLDRIPVLEGARESVARGVFSSLQPQNVRLRRAVRDLDRAQALPDYPLLFDPQTAGGLLAGIPAARVEACVAALRAAGYAQAAVIGEVLARSDALEPIL